MSVYSKESMEIQKFAAFVMTYERPAQVIQTIAKLLSQTFPPTEVLIVDNSNSFETKRAIENLMDYRISYHRMGYNAGPAGAASVGLSMMADKGYDWIFWGDDDDPPPYPDTFENLFKIILERTDDQIGVIGSLGGKLNRRTGRTTNFSNKELSRIVEADYVPGNKMMIVNSAVVKLGVLPTERLFFGFEELDFCLKVQKVGFKILFDGRGILAQRTAAGNIAADYRWRGKAIGDERKLWRQYYSTRNMLIILRTNGFWIAVIFILFRTVIKSVYGFRFGWTYGRKHFRIQFLAMSHFLSNRLGSSDLNRILA